MRFFFSVMTSWLFFFSFFWGGLIRHRESLVRTHAVYSGDNRNELVSGTFHNVACNYKLIKIKNKNKFFLKNCAILQLILRNKRNEAPRCIKITRIPHHAIISCHSTPWFVFIPYIVYPSIYVYMTTRVT